MNVLVHFEDGPLRGEVHERPDAPPEILIQTAAARGKSFVGHVDIDPPPGDEYMDIVTTRYLREYTPHRVGCVTYWVDDLERLQAYLEDTWEEPGDRTEQYEADRAVVRGWIERAQTVPSGTLEPCQPPPTP